MEEDRKVLAQFKDENGVLVKTPFDIPVTVTPDLLQSLCNALIGEVNWHNVCYASHVYESDGFVKRALLYGNA